MKKLSILLFALFLFPLSAEQIRVGLLNGPSCIPCAYLLENCEVINEIPVQYTKFSDVQALLPKMIKKEIDVGFMPVNVATKVYNSTNKAIICCGITGNGNLALITKDKNVKRFDDLKGKKISVAGQGATPEYLFRYLLNSNKISEDAKGVTLSFSTPTAQIAPALLSDTIEYAVVPEPFATIASIKSKDVVYAINLQDEYEYFAGQGKIYPLTLMVVRKEFAEKNENLMKIFLSAYEEACSWTINHPVAAGNLCEKYDLGLAAPVVISAIPKANYTFIPSKESKEPVEALLNIFATYAPESFGGKLPEEDFYFQ